MLELTSGTPGGHIAADTGLVVRTAGRMLDLSLACADLSRVFVSTVDLPSAGSGQASGGAFARAHDAVRNDGSALIDHLIEVLHGDADRLYQVASALHTADEKATRRWPR